MQRWRKGTSGPFEAIYPPVQLPCGGGAGAALADFAEYGKIWHRSHLGHTGEICDFDIERIPRCQIYQVIAQDGKVYLLYEAKGLVNTTIERVAHL